MKKFIATATLALSIVTMLTFTACRDGEEDEPAILTQTEYEIYAGETEQVSGTGLKGVVWKSYDKFIAEITDDATISAHKVGRTAINPLSVDAIVQINVKPKITAYSEPVIKYGQKYINGQLEQVEGGTSPQYLWGTHKALMPHYIRKSGLPWELASESSESMIFTTGNNTTPMIGYLFDKDGRMHSAGMYVSPYYASQIVDFLDERFAIYSVNEYNYTADFAHVKISDNDKVTINYVGRMDYSGSSKYILIIYTAVDDDGYIRSRSKSVCDEILHKFEKAVISL